MFSPNALSSSCDEIELASTGMSATTRGAPRCGHVNRTVNLLVSNKERDTTNCVGVRPGSNTMNSPSFLAGVVGSVHNEVGGGSLRVATVCRLHQVEDVIGKTG